MYITVLKDIIKAHFIFAEAQVYNSARRHGSQNSQSNYANFRFWFSSCGSTSAEHNSSSPNFVNYSVDTVVQLGSILYNVESCESKIIILLQQDHPVSYHTLQDIVVVSYEIY